MKNEICVWIRKVAPKYKLSALYYPENDVYALDRKGRAIQTFNSKTFFEIPKLGRERMLNPLIRLGLNHNLGESIKDQVFTDRKSGIKIV